MNVVDGQRRCEREDVKDCLVESSPSSFEDGDACGLALLSGHTLIPPELGKNNQAK